MNKILTLCDKCSQEMAVGFKTKRLFEVTTELKKACENCGKKGDKYSLARFLIQSKKKGGESSAD